MILLAPPGLSSLGVLLLLAGPLFFDISDLCNQNFLMVLGPDEKTKKLCARIDKVIGVYIDDIESDFLILLKDALIEVGDNQAMVNQMFSLFFYGVYCSYGVDSHIARSLQKEFAPELSDLKKNSNFDGTIIH